MPRRKKIDELVVVQLLEQAKGKLGDVGEVNRLLRELGKFYDPLTGGAMVDGAARRRLVELLERGQRDEVLAAIDQYLETYKGRIS